MLISRFEQKQGCALNILRWCHGKERFRAVSPWPFVLWFFSRVKDFNEATSRMLFHAMFEDESNMMRVA
jgi:hypothetical protein